MASEIEKAVAEAKAMLGLFDVPRIENPLDLWSGEFGDAYADRCKPDEKEIIARAGLWREILGHLHEPPQSFAEIGANQGQNFRALRSIYGATAELVGIEPNDKARARLCEVADVTLAGMAQDVPLPNGRVDLAFTSGVLIHIPPSDLLDACAEIVRISSRYVVAIEYFHPIPVEAMYRGMGNAMFKRDFGAFYLDNFPGMKPIAAGFSWKRLTGLDHLTWWLLEKPQTVYDIRTDEEVAMTRRTKIVA